jgi:hypothetical protein
MLKGLPRFGLGLGLACAAMVASAAMSAPVSAAVGPASAANPGAPASVSEDRDVEEVDAAAYRCGANLELVSVGGTIPIWKVIYKHCTSGNDSVRVRAIVSGWEDGPCKTVGPRQAKLIWDFPPGASFDRIDRC